MHSPGGSAPGGRAMIAAAQTADPIGNELEAPCNERDKRVAHDRIVVVEVEPPPKDVTEKFANPGDSPKAAAIGCEAT